MEEQTPTVSPDLACEGFLEKVLGPVFAAGWNPLDGLTSIEVRLLLHAGVLLHTIGVTLDIYSC
jgi:hypothetical protein